MKSIGARIKRARKILKKSQAEFADELGITKQAISNIETSKSFPSIPTLFELMCKYNININYILSGEGEMFQKKEENRKELTERVLNEIEEMLKKFI